MALNRRFYDDLAQPFARSRDFYPPGYSWLLRHLPKPCPRLLDIGCGEGRLGRYLLVAQAVDAYEGLDQSVTLLKNASERTRGRYWRRDISVTGFLSDLDTFQTIALLSTLQHIPGRSRRVQLLQEIGAHLDPQGKLFLANWQFIGSERQRRKIKDWSEVGLSPDDVEANDYLLSWERGGQGRRYVALIDPSETQALAQDAGFEVKAQMLSDGREGNLNLYTLLRRSSSFSRFSDSLSGSRLPVRQPKCYNVTRRRYYE